MRKGAFTHECEVCGLKLLLTSDLSYELGWDYPPNMGEWGIVSPRTCGACGIEQTLWYALVVLKKATSELTERQLAVGWRIHNEKERA